MNYSLFPTWVLPEIHLFSFLRFLHLFYVRTIHMIDLFHALLIYFTNDSFVFLHDSLASLFSYFHIWFIYSCKLFIICLVCFLYLTPSFSHEPWWLVFHMIRSCSHVICSHGFFAFAWSFLNNSFVLDLIFLNKLKSCRFFRLWFSFTYISLIYFSFTVHFMLNDTFTCDYRWLWGRLTRLYPMPATKTCWTRCWTSLYPIWNVAWQYSTFHSRKSNQRSFLNIDVSNKVKSSSGPSRSALLWQWSMWSDRKDQWTLEVDEPQSITASFLALSFTKPGGFRVSHSDAG